MLRRLTDFLALLSILLLAGAATARQSASDAIPTVTLQAGRTVDLLIEAARYDGDPVDATDTAYPDMLRTAMRLAPPAPPPWPDYQSRWFAIRLLNPVGSPGDWMLRMDTDPLYLPQMTVLDDAGRLQSTAQRLDARTALPDTGAAIAVGQRFPLLIPSGEARIVLLRVNALGFGSLTADILSREAWTDWAVQRQAILAFAMAMIAATAIYTLVIGTGIRRTAYLWYGLHCGMLLVFWMNIYGIFADLFGFTDHTRLVYKASGMALVATAPLLTLTLLDVQGFAPRLSKALLGTGIVGFALIIPIIALHPWPDLQRAWIRGPDWHYLVTIASYVLMAPAAILALRHRIAGAGWFLAGWLIYMIGTFHTLAAYFGLLPFTGTALFLGFALAGWETLMSAQALATRIRVLSEEKAAAEAQRRAQQDFLAAISHDLRTPLNAILGAAATADDRGLPDAARQRLGTIRRAGKILLALISDLLDRASISSGSLTILHRPFPLRDCIQDAVELVRERAEEKGLLIRVNADADLPAWIEADELRLKQILFNLAENAVKFTERGEIVMTAATDKSGRLEIVVSDTGPGIPFEEQDAIFLPYRRGVAAADQRYGSRGLGLSIARDLARAMGGDITVESDFRQGSRFHLVLPLVPAVAVSRSLTSRLVLLVDDVALNREVGAALLRSEGHLVRSCMAAEVLEQLDRETPDAILLDLQMPDLDGFELARRLRCLADERKANLPIIALTAAIDDDTRRRLASLGIFEIILKPLTVDALRSAFQQAITDEPPIVNYALQLRLAREIGHDNWATALQRFREASRDLLRDAAEALPNQRTELLHRFAGMAGALGLDAVSQLATEMEQQQRKGDSVLDDLPALEALWSRSMERCLLQPLERSTQ